MVPITTDFPPKQLRYKQGKEHPAHVVMVVVVVVAYVEDFLLKTEFVLVRMSTVV